MPEYPYDISHETENTSCSLKFFQAGPILGQPIKQLRVNWIGKSQQLQVSLLLGFGWKFGCVLLVKVMEGLHRFFARLLSLGIQRLKETTTDDFVCFIARSRQPGRLNT